MINLSYPDVGDLDAKVVALVEQYGGVVEGGGTFFGPVPMRDLEVDHEDGEQYGKLYDALENLLSSWVTNPDNWNIWTDDEDEDEDDDEDS